MKLATTFLILFVTLALHGCSSTGVKNDTSVHDAEKTVLISDADLPDWLIEAMNADQNLTTSSPFVLDELNIQSTIAGNLEKSQKQDSYWYFLVNIGTSTPVECYAFTSYDGVANAFNRMTSTVSELVAEGLKKPLLNTTNYSIGAGHINGTPFISQEKMLILGPEDQRTIGMVKGFAAEADGILKVCIHNQVGYKQAFRSVFNSFVTAFPEKHSDHQPLFQSAYQMRVNDMIVGYGFEKMTIDQDGDIKMIESTSSIMPISERDQAASDSVQISWSRPNGNLINAHEYNIENGQLSSQYDLMRENDQWYVKGQLQGKDINQAIEYKGELSSSLALYKAIAESTSTKNTSTELNIWVSEADPTSITKTVVNSLSDNPNANVNLVMGPLSMNALADNNGITKTADMELGPITVKIDTIYTEGRPTLP